MSEERSVSLFDDEQRWAEYLRRVAVIESLPENQSGADKTWVHETIAAWDEHYRRAVRVR